MKKQLKIALLAIVAVLGLCSLQSCSETDKATSGVWYLVSFGRGGENIQCTWGECLVFTGNNEVMWGLRDHGMTNSYFKYTSTGNSFKCKGIDGSEDITFTIKSVSGNNMTTTSNDGYTRNWRR